MERRSRRSTGSIKRKSFVEFFAFLYKKNYPRAEFPNKSFRFCPSVCLLVDIMVRKLRFHEKKLLKKVDFINWEVDKNLHEVTVMRKFFIQKREDYTKYNDLSRRIRDLARQIKELDANDPFRIEATRTLLDKL